MSGPKCSSYSVRDRERAAAQLRAAEQRVRELREQQAVLEARAAEVGALTGERLILGALPPGPGASVEQQAAWSRTVSERQAEDVRRISEALLRLRTDQLLQTLVGAEGGATARRVAQGPAGAVDPAQPAAATMNAAVTAVLDAVDPDATADEIAQVESVARRIPGADRGHAKVLLMELEAVVRSVEEAASRRRRDRTVALDLMPLLDGLEGRDIEAMKELLAAVVDGRSALASADEEAVRGAASRARREADRRYVAEVLRASLVDLGYEVDEGFRTALAEADGEPVFVRRPEDSVYATEIRHDGRTITTRVVRARSDTAPDADERAEERFCRDFGDLTQMAHDAGVTFQLLEHRAPGEVAVEHVPAAAAPARSSRRPAERRRAR